MIPGFIHRRADGSHHVQIHPPLDIPTEGSLEEQIQELTAAATTAIERQVRAHPEQWVWMHRRWRTQPREVA
jgi:KDO2-lipid IV(A) lauroyltransferase